MTPPLKEKYLKEIVPALKERHGYTSVMAVPRLVKVTVSIGLGEAVREGKAIEAATQDLAAITGQRPVVTRAKKSIAAFRLRAGMPIGLKVTLRGDRMYYFLDKLLNVVLPRIRDFRGVSPKAFDNRGSYSLGLREQIIFPEIDYSKIDRARGLEVTIVTSAKTDEEAHSLLTLCGMPFARSAAA
ncbi:MAG: 50S ribosomal protein L5 [Chloroflexi bacterium]|nr:50S ribosomal protein L5 [Chloroflexota bacterium]